MAAIDPTEEIEDDAEVPRLPRSTLKLVKETINDNGSDSEEDDEYMRELLLGGGDDDSEDDEEDEANGGPSDPTKSKKALRAAALKELLDATQGEDSDEEMDDAETGKKGKKTNGAKGKGKAVVEGDEEESEEDDESEEGDVDGLDLEQFVICTLDTQTVSLEHHTSHALFTNSMTALPAAPRAHYRRRGEGFLRQLRHSHHLRYRQLRYQRGHRLR